jgi:hypothetical protein
MSGEGAGAVAVATGAVREERLVLGGAPAARTVAAGEAFSFGAADIHRVSTRVPSPRSRSTPTRRRCGGWARTR